MFYYSCLIVDDNVIDAEYLQNQLRQLPVLTRSNLCASVDEASHQLIEHQCDLIFLDIKMPGQSGIDWIRTLPYQPHIIVTTAYPEYAADCYDLDIIDYLVKPFDTERLNRAVNRALMGRLNQGPRLDKKFLFLHTNRQLQRFDFKEIKYLEAQGPNTKLFLRDDLSIINESISAFEERLPAHQFLRVHKSFIINLDRLTRIDYRAIWLDETKIPIGINYRDAVFNLVNWKIRKKSKSDLDES